MHFCYWHFLTNCCAKLIFLFQFIQLLNQVVRRERAGRSPNLFPCPVGDQSGDTLNTQLPGELSVLIDVDLQYAYAITHLLGDLL